MGSTQTISWTFTGSPGDSVKIELLKAGSSIRTIADAAAMGSGGSGSYSWAIPTDLEPANDYRIRVTSVQKPNLTDDSNANFTVALPMPTLTVDPASGSPGENIVLRATLVDSFGSPLSARTLDFSVEGTGIGSADTGDDGSATLAYSVPDTLGGGAKTLSVTFAGDTLFDTAQGTAVLTINPAATSLSTADCSGTYTTTVTLRQFDLRRATDNAVLSGKTVAYRIDGTQIGTAQTDASGNSELVWRINEGAATRTITVEFTSDSAYQPSSATATLTVLPGTPLIWVANTSVYQSYKAGLYAYFRALPGSINQAGKTVRFSVDGTAVGNAVTDSGGAARLTYDPVGLAQGDHTIRCDYDGDPILAAGYGTGTLTVLGKRPYIWVADRTVNVGMSASLYAYFRTLPDYAEQAGKTLTFKVDGTPVATAVTDAHGVVRCPYDTHGMAQGTHTIRCEFAGDASVAAGYGEAPLTILPAKPYIWVADRTVNVGMSASLYAYFRTLPDYIEQPGKTVKFKVDGTLVATMQTDQHGVARGSYDTHGMAQGTHTIRCEFAGDASVAAGYGEAPLTILPAKPYIWVADRTVRAGTAAPLYAYFRILPDLIPQPGKIVTFKIDGTPVATVMTDGQGVARYQYDTTGLAIGAHVIRCQFSGDSQVAAGYGDGTLTID